MDEASRCDSIALMQNGEILEVDSLANVIDKHPQNLYAVKGEKKYQLMKDIRTYSGTLSCFAFGEVSHVSLKDSELSGEGLSAFLGELNHTGLSIKKIKPNIEDTFIKLMLEKAQNA
jgi:ABC-2 type transport system ATP-binding protein